MSRPVAVVLADAWTRPSAGDHTDDTEAVADLLRRSGHGFDVRTAGPAGDRPLREALSDPDTVLFAHPGASGDDEAAFRRLRADKGAIRRFVHGGGCYLGVCMGAFLVERGFLNLVGLAVEEYWSRPGADPSTPDPALVTVRWRGAERRMYFQDGGVIRPTRRALAETEILATYADGTVAACVTRCGDGAVGVVGPHPEAPPSWFHDHGVDLPADHDHDLGIDLVDTLFRTVHGPSSPP